MGRHKGNLRVFLKDPRYSIIAQKRFAAMICCIIAEYEASHSSRRLHNKLLSELRDVRNKGRNKSPQDWERFDYLFGLSKFHPDVRRFEKRIQKKPPNAKHLTIFYQPRKTLEDILGESFFQDYVGKLLLRVQMKEVKGEAPRWCYLNLQALYKRLFKEELSQNERFYVPRPRSFARLNARLFEKAIRFKANAFVIDFSHLSDSGAARLSKIIHYAKN
jgi:hypothetical protein